MSCKKVLKSVQVVVVFQQKGMAKSMGFRDINASVAIQIFHQKDDRINYKKLSSKSIFIKDKP